MNTERLEQLINVMTRVRDKNLKFDIQDWFGDENLGSDSQIQKFKTAILDDDIKHRCGFSACVGGWLAMSPEFGAVNGCPIGVYGTVKFLANNEVFIGGEAVAKFLECDPDLGDQICGIDNTDVRERENGEDDDYSLFYEEFMADLTAEQVVHRLKQLRTKEAD